MERASGSSLAHADRYLYGPAMELVDRVLLLIELATVRNKFSEEQAQGLLRDLENGVERETRNGQTWLYFSSFDQLDERDNERDDIRVECGEDGDIVLSWQRNRRETNRSTEESLRVDPDVIQQSRARIRAALGMHIPD